MTEFLRSHNLQQHPERAFDTLTTVGEYNSVMPNERYRAEYHDDPV